MKIKLETELALAYILEEWNGEATKYSDDVGEYKYRGTEEMGDSRWENHFFGVIERKSDGKLFGHHYSIGKSESQDYRSWDGENELEFVEVVEEINVVEIKTYRVVGDD